MKTEEEFLQEKKELREMLEKNFITNDFETKIESFFSHLTNPYFWRYLKEDEEYDLISCITEMFLDQIDDTKERKKYVEIILSTCPEELKHEVKKTIKISSPLEVYFPDTYSFLDSDNL